MKINHTDSGIEYKENVALRLLPFALWILIAVWFNSGSNIPSFIFWIFWVYWGVMISVYNPDFIMYQEGIEVKIWWMRPFIRWDDIQGAYQDIYRTRIRTRNLVPPSFMVRMFINSGFFIMGWRENYAEILRVLSEKLGSRFHPR